MKEIKSVVSEKDLDTLTFYTRLCAFVADTTVKQGDVILLGYPLQAAMPEHVRRNDLRIYEQVGQIVSFNM